jgi:Xaa-Pro aminopeptidase
VENFMKPERDTRDLAILADSHTNRDLLWATGFSVGDPVPYFEARGRKYLVLSDLEIGRARKQAKVHGVLPLSKYLKRLKRRGVERPGLADVLVEVLTERRVKAVRVPHDFPVFAADRLRKAKVKVTPCLPPFFPARAVKTETEIAAIRDAAARTVAAMREGIDLIRRSKPVRGILRLDGDPLTSERVRSAIEIGGLLRGLTPTETIVAGGEQAVDPHDCGSGPLRAGFPIVLDVFPRDTLTGYHADITRTVFRGRPSPKVRALYDAVREAHAAAMGEVRAGVPAKEVHQAVLDVFKARGMKTGPDGKGGMQGFFHGTGHGLGLSVHEAPRVGAIEEPLVENAVITIEPGLYYPGLGGVRHEDDVAVRADGAENLVDFEIDFVV